MFSFSRGHLWQSTKNQVRLINVKNNKIGWMLARYGLIWASTTTNRKTNRKNGGKNIHQSYVHVPYGDPGNGMYGEMFGKITGRLVDAVNDQLLTLAKSVPFTESVFNIGDYGTADGTASMETIRKLLNVLKGHHGEDTQFQVIYEDQAVNDFNSLFRRLSGIIPDPPSYLQDMTNVFVLASGTSFYQQCVPSNSMHIIISTTAVHWLSRRPVAYQNSIFCFPDSSDEEKQLMQKQSAKDWETFLILRGRELRKGGIMMIAAACNYEEAENIPEVNLNKALPILNKLWKELRDEGIIREEEFINTNLDMWYHTMTQLEQPFKDETSPVMKANLRLLSAEIKCSNLDVLEQWRQKKEDTGIDDRDLFARELTKATRSYTNSAFLGGLSETRSVDERKKIVDILFEQFEREVQCIHPEYFKNYFRFAYLFIQKVRV